MRQFDHERLEVYQLAADFFVLADGWFKKRILSRRTVLGDQLSRSAVSMPLNIAEGAGEFRPKEKARFYRIALRSTSESAAAVGLFARAGDLAADAAEEGRALLLRIAPMLVRLCRTHDPSFLRKNTRATAPKSAEAREHSDSGSGSGSG
ncbi:MAG: four helix bundle protein [Gemmatimonadetes bacterium]|nr:four helix bundle protein [Gemmatimonadota bacterium]